MERERQRAAERPDYGHVLRLQCLSTGLPEPVLEYRFEMGRRWRVDLAFIVGGRDVAVEIEGGAESTEGGRHRRRTGYLADLEKYNALTLQGWRLLRVTPQMVESGEALKLIERALRGGA